MFENDVFISYSHKDNEPLPGETVGWVSDLHRVLQVRVGQILGERPKIFFDPQQGGNVHISDDVFDKVRNSATLVSVLSPSYFNSDWCPRELDAFYQACQSSGRLRVGNRERVFKVFKTQLREQEERGKLPSVIRDFLGYKFYAVDEETETVREFWRAFGEAEKQQFFKKADDLAQDISRMLRQLRGKEPGKGKGFVYLAMTSSDLKEERETLYRELDRSGYVVLPDRRLPETFPEIGGVVREQVARCRLSVHMIGSRYGSIPDGADVSIPVLQNDIAAEHSKRSDLTRLVWLAAGPAAVEDQRQKGFIERLQTVLEPQDKMTPLRGSPGDLKDEVLRCLERAPQTPKLPRQGLMQPRVYLICNEGDDVRAVQKHLFDGGCEPTLPLFTGDEADIRQEHENNLRSCDGVLLYWGVGGDAWRRKKQGEVLLKSAGLGRTQGAPLTLLYVAPPESRDKDMLLTHEVMVARQPPEGPSAELLADFIAKLKDDGSKGPDDPD